MVSASEIKNIYVHIKSKLLCTVILIVLSLPLSWWLLSERLVHPCASSLMFPFFLLVCFPFRNGKRVSRKKEHLDANAHLNKFLKKASTPNLNINGLCSEDTFIFICMYICTLSDGFVIQFPQGNYLITARVRSTTGRYCFHRCLSVHRGGGPASHPIILATSNQNL